MEPPHILFVIFMIFALFTILICTILDNTPEDMYPTDIKIISINKETTALNLLKNSTYQIEFNLDMEDRQVYISNFSNNSSFFKNKDEIYTIVWTPTYTQEREITINIIRNNNEKTEQKINLIVE